MTRWIHVAVGVIRNASGDVLLAKRHADAHQGGLWEFPGGKVESDESAMQALNRELEEEVAIIALEPQPLIQIRHHYSDKSVLLDVWEVSRFQGEPHGNENQPLTWVPVEQLSVESDTAYPLPAANRGIVKALQLPSVLAITGGYDEQHSFSERLQQTLAAGCRLIQLRAPGGRSLSSNQIQQLTQESFALCRDYGARLVINSRLLAGLSAESNDVGSLLASGDLGVHLTAADLSATGGRRPRYFGHAPTLMGTSCHNREELSLAGELDLDYVLLSPVKPTASHPQSVTLGWEGFAALSETVNIPVYALGGLSADDVSQARQHGAQGVAGIRAFWG